MPRREREARQKAAGAYQFLREREEQSYRDWADSLHARGVGARYPRSRRLADLRAGRPVVVAVHELPASARPGDRPTLTRADGDEYWHRQHEAMTVYADNQAAPGAAAAAGSLLDEYLDL